MEDSKKWKEESYVKISKERDYQLIRLKELMEDAEDCNWYICKLERQLQCKHTDMILTYDGFAEGHLVETCTSCDYEYYYY